MILPKAAGKPVVASMLAVVLGLLAGRSSLAEDAHHQHMPAHHQEVRLQEPGESVFATLQEVIAELEADPATDWQRVDLEKLRSHLVDMHQVMTEVDVVEQNPVPGGLAMTVVARNDRAAASLALLLRVHPRFLAAEYGWQMSLLEQNGHHFRLQTTTSNGNDVARLRAFGYAGQLAAGLHHVRHHWMMATGQQHH